MLHRGLDGALQLASARFERALRKLGFLRLPLQAALLLAAPGQLALGFDHPVAQLRVALLAVGQLHVQLLEAALGGDAALLQLLQLRIDLGQVGRDLFAAGAGLLGQLRQAQRLDLQLVGPALAFAGLAPDGHQALRCTGVAGLGADQGRARFFGDQRLRAQLLFEVLDLLLPRQQAGLLGVLREEAGAVGGDRVAALEVDDLARLELRPRRQRLLETRRSKAAMQPVRQQRLLAGVIQAQQLRQARQRRLGFRRPGLRRAVERQLGRRRVAAEGAHHVEPRHLQRIHALAQCGFERVLPTLLDVDAAPQALQAIQPVLRQPRLELAVGPDLFLQSPERFQSGRQIRLLAAFAVDRLLARPALAIELRHLLLQFMQPGIGELRGLLRRGELRLQVGQAHFVGRGQRVAVGRQLFTPQCQRARLLFDVALVGGQHLNLLLHLAHARPLLGGAGLGLTQRIVELGELLRLLLDLGGQQDRLFFGLLALPRQRLQFGGSVVSAGRPLHALLLQLRQPLLDPLPALDHETDLGFQPSHFGAGFIKLALRLIDLVAGGIVGLADGLQVALDPTQVGHPRLEFGHGFFGLGLDPALVDFTLGALEKPELVLLQRGLRLPQVVLLRDLGLLFQLVEVAVELAQDVFDPGQVLAGVGDPALGLAAALLVLGDPRGFLQEQAQFLRLGFDDAADRALADDGVGARPQPGAQKHVLHVAPAHRLVVDVVAAGAVARQYPLDRNLRELAPLAAGAVVGIVEHQFHRRPRRRLAGRGPVEDHVLHRFAAQFAGARLAQHPAHRVHDVGLAAAVGTDHPDQLARQHEVGGFGEGFEPG